jgi:Trypsin
MTSTFYQGETGGALICDEMVVAIVTGPTKENEPGVYTKITPYRVQIDSFVLNQRRMHG